MLSTQIPTKSKQYGITRTLVIHKIFYNIKAKAWYNKGDGIIEVISIIIFLRMCKQKEAPQHQQFDNYTYLFCCSI